MKNLQKLMAASLLSVVLVAPVCAGDMNEPPAPAPGAPSTAPSGGGTESPVLPTTAPDDSTTPSVPVLDTRTFVFDLLKGLLSIY